MLHNKTERTGVSGAIMAAICCLAPAALVLLTATGGGWSLGLLQLPMAVPVSIVVLSLMGCVLLRYQQRKRA